MSDESLGQRVQDLETALKVALAVIGHIPPAQYTEAFHDSEKRLRATAPGAAKLLYDGYFFHQETLSKLPPG